ncbi:MAG: WD40/YVTN/BNR-like repeat-containing protein [Acidobacteriota bacterium]
MSRRWWVVVGLAFVAGAGWVAAKDRGGAIIAPMAARSLLLDVTAVGERLVAVGDRGHILISADRGASWRQVPAPVDVMLTSVAFADGSVGCAVGHDSVILRTSDGGESWLLVHSDPETESPLFDVAFVSPTQGFAIGAYGLFLESRDGGQSWESRTIFDGDAHLHHLSRTADGRLYVAAEQGIVLTSDDGGESWKELPSPYEGSLFGTLPLDGRALLLFGLRGHAYRSDDGGANWLEVRTGVDAMLTSACRLADGRIVLVGLAGSVLVSDDGGRSFALQQQRDRLGIASAVPTSETSIVVAGEFGVRTQQLPAGGAAAR